MEVYGSDHDRVWFTQLTPRPWVKGVDHGQNFVKFAVGFMGLETRLCMEGTARSTAVDQGVVDEFAKFKITICLL